jgi:hypothetical protein
MKHRPIKEEVVQQYEQKIEQVKDDKRSKKRKIFECNGLFECNARPIEIWDRK